MPPRNVQLDGADTLVRDYARNPGRSARATCGYFCTCTSTARMSFSQCPDSTLRKRVQDSKSRARYRVSRELRRPVADSQSCTSLAASATALNSGSLGRGIRDAEVG